MSGGVDSSVAASLLVDAGHDVVGLSMQLYDQRDGQTSFGTCCTIDDLHDARRVADALGIPHYVLNFERQFEERVVADFVREYAAGRTPIPCVHCNADLKFATLLERATGLGGHAVATGHYARVDTDALSGRRILRRGIDASRDQSYFLFSLDQPQLAGAIFPLGTWPKARVREYARDRRLPTAEKPESREICFVPSGHYADFVERRAPDRRTEGAIVDQGGREIGRHAGVHRFTVGQRRGLGVASATPLFVLGLDAEARHVTVGPRAALARTRLTASRVSWVAGEPPAPGRPVSAQIRYKHPPASAHLHPLRDAGRVAVEFDDPQHAVTPGQAVVFFDDDVVLGGGWID
jgi:tRNA-specific 2-thiouridylase